MALHSRKSPSQTKRFKTCPGTFALVLNLPIEQQNVGGEAAQIGTCVHKIIEACLIEGANPSDFRNRIIVIEETENNGEEARILKPNAKTPKRNEIWYIVDSAMIDGADVMVDYVRSRVIDLGLDELDKRQVQAESRTNALPDRDDTDGTADVTLACPDYSELELVDYKNGYNLVDHNDNDQLRNYLTGKAEEHKWRFKKYTITVVQPNCPHEEGVIRSVSYTAAELKKFQKELRTWVERTDEAEADPLAPGPDWEEINPKWAKKWLKASADGCFWCDGKTVCPAWRKFKSEEAKRDFSDLPPPPEEVAKLKPRSAKEAEHWLSWAPLVDKTIQEASAYLLRHLERGKPSERFKLGRGRSNRVLKEEFTAESSPYLNADRIAKLLVAKKLVEESNAKRVAELLLTERELKSGPQIEKIVPKEKRPLFNKLCLDKPEGRLTVVPIDAPGEAVVPGPIFPPLPGDDDGAEFG